MDLYTRNGVIAELSSKNYRKYRLFASLIYLPGTAARVYVTTIESVKKSRAFYSVFGNKKSDRVKATTKCYALSIALCYAMYRLSFESFPTSVRHCSVGLLRRSM